MKFILTLVCLSSVFSVVGCKVVDDTDYEYLDSWAVQATTLQNRISQQSPFRLAEFPATHNSFNAQAYSNGFSYPDPNHVPSMLNQLRMGKRMINMDLHWDIHYNQTTRLITTDIVLCHDSSEFGFCSMWDRTFREGLVEVRGWLENNDEVIILKLQDELDGHYKEAYNSINIEMGDLVYKPTSPCSTFDMEVSKAEILATGKKIIITGAKPSTCNKSWGEFVYWDEGMFGSVNHENFEPYPICNNSIEDIQQKIFGATNDGTQVAQIILQKNEMTVEQVSTLAQCGVTAISYEPLRWWDERLVAQIWSWDTDKPSKNNTAHNCALQQANGRFSDESCNMSYSFACQHAENRGWKITNTMATWANGELACESVFGEEGYAFSTPVNGYENAQLNDVKSALGLEAVWLNYSDSLEEGDWVY